MTRVRFPINTEIPPQRWDDRAAFRHDIFEPQDFIAKLAALVPKPGVNPGSSPGQALTRFHGVLAGTPDRPNSKYRVDVTPAKRGRRGHTRQENEAKTPEQRHRAMTGFCSCKTGHGLAAGCLTETGGVETDWKAPDSAQNPVIATVEWPGKETMQAYSDTGFKS